MNAILKLLESLYSVTRIPALGTMLQTLRDAQSRKAGIEGSIRVRKEQAEMLRRDAKAVVPGNQRKSS